MNDKFILDACCGGKMFWFDKNQPNTIYIDNNPRCLNISPESPNFEVKPDLVMDFTDLKFNDNSFKLVVFDPPHLCRLQETSILSKKFGCLNSETWPYDLSKGFAECWRVLEDYGILIFKWNITEIPANKILSLFNATPLFGHPTGSKSKTRWYCFMKIPKSQSKGKKNHGE